MSKDGAFFVVKMFIKKYKHNGEVAWSFTFDKKDRVGTRCAVASLPAPDAIALPARTPRPSRLSADPRTTATIRPVCASRGRLTTSATPTPSPSACSSRTPRSRSCCVAAARPVHHQQPHLQGGAQRPEHPQCGGNRELGQLGLPTAAGLGRRARPAGGFLPASGRRRKPCR